jgi:hypothetical protein
MLCRVKYKLLLANTTKYIREEETLDCRLSHIVIVHNIFFSYFLFYLGAFNNCSIFQFAYISLYVRANDAIQCLVPTMMLDDDDDVPRLCTDDDYCWAAMEFRVRVRNSNATKHKTCFMFFL